MSFAEIEQKILERLRMRAADPVHWSGPEIRVGPESEVENVEALRQLAPAVWIIYDGIRPLENPGETVLTVQKVALDFYAVVCAKSARGNGKNIVARDLAGEIETFVIESLLGFDVGGGKRLRLNESAGPSYDAGYCHVPLAFSCAITVRGKP